MVRSGPTASFSPARSVPISTWPRPARRHGSPDCSCSARSGGELGSRHRVWRVVKLLGMVTGSRLRRHARGDRRLLAALPGRLRRSRPPRAPRWGWPSCRSGCASRSRRSSRSTTSPAEGGGLGGGGGGEEGGGGVGGLREPLRCRRDEGGIRGLGRGGEGSWRLGGLDEGAGGGGGGGEGCGGSGRSWEGGGEDRPDVQGGWGRGSRARPPWGTREVLAGR